MLFRQLFDDESSTFTYLIAADFGREAVIIDPVKRHVDQYLQLIKELDLTLVALLETHLHADHITGSGELRQKTNCTLMMGHPCRAECVSTTFNDQDVLKFDGLEIQVLYTPGHTDDSYCFLIDGRVFTGDTLLIRGTGRTDFQHGDAGMQYDSLFTQLLTLPEQTLVYPAHDYKGMTVSTIFEEKRFNPRLQVSSREAYIEQMNNLNLPYPKKIDVAIPANQNCGLID